MNNKFNPIEGFKIELTYSRELIASAIAAHLSLWVTGLAASFLSLCEATVHKGYQARADVDGKLSFAIAVGLEATTHVATQAKELAIELGIATLRRIKRPILGLVLPPLNTLVERYVGVKNIVQSALTTYTDGAVGEPIQVNAVAQGSVLLPAGEASVDGQELLVPTSDDAVIAEAENKHPVDVEAEASLSLPLSDERPKALADEQEKGEGTVERRPKRRGREGST